MALIGINPVGNEPQIPSKLERVALGFQIANNAIGTIMGIPKAMYELGILKEEKKNAPVKRATEMADKFTITTQDDPNAMFIPEDTNIPGFSGKWIKPKVDLVEQERQRKTGPVTPQTKAYFDKVVKGTDLEGYEPSNEGDAQEKINLFFTLKQKQQAETNAPLTKYQEVVTGQGERRLSLMEAGLKARKQGTLTPKGIIKQLDNLEKFYEKGMQNSEWFKSNYIPMVGQVRKFFAENIKIDDPVSAEFNSMLNAVVLDYTKTKQGSRPSNYDVQVIKEQIFPARGDLPNVVRAKFKGIKRMMEMLDSDANADRSLAVDEALEIVRGESGDVNPDVFAE